MLRHLIKEYKEHVMIADVFPKQEVSILYGDSGLGKSVSTIKALNKDGVIPIHLDLDTNINPKTFDLEVIHLDGRAVLKDILKNKKVEVPDEGVIIVDTWQLLSETMGEELAMKFLYNLRDNGLTVILLAHGNKHKNDRDNPDTPAQYVNHFAAKLWLYRGREITTGTKKSDETVNLKVIKLRGYTGVDITYNWMRE